MAGATAECVWDGSGVPLWHQPSTLGPAVPWYRGEVAQLVEHSAENRGVAGSSPALAIDGESLATFPRELFSRRSGFVPRPRMSGGATDKQHNLRAKSLAAL